jgi:hypothetical protein
MGISKEILIFGLLAILVVIILIFAFILIGIQAFSIPGAFGSVVNSAFPARKIFYLFIFVKFKKIFFHLK